MYCRMNFNEYHNLYNKHLSVSWLHVLNRSAWLSVICRPQNKHIWTPPFLFFPRVQKENIMGKKWETYILARWHWKRWTKNVWSSVGQGQLGHGKIKWTKNRRAHIRTSRATIPMFATSKRNMADHLVKGLLTFSLSPSSCKPLLQFSHRSPKHLFPIQVGILRSLCLSFSCSPHVYHLTSNASILLIHTFFCLNYHLDRYDQPTLVM